MATAPTFLHALRGIVGLLPGALCGPPTAVCARTHARMQMSAGRAGEAEASRIRGLLSLREQELQEVRVNLQSEMRRDEIEQPGGGHMHAWWRSRLHSVTACWAAAWP